MPAYLICGSDRPKVQRAVARLRRRVVAEVGSDLNVDVFDAEAGGAEAVIQAAETPGFALGTRLLLVTNGHKWKAKQRQAVARYLEDPMPGTCLTIEGETFGERDVLHKAVAKVGQVLCYDLPKKQELAGWAVRRARARGLRMSVPVARHLLALSGDAPERLEREIEKLAMYCGGEEATDEAIDAVCSAAVEARIFDLMDAVGARDRSKAFALLETVFAAGEDANRVLYSLKRHVHQLEEASRLSHSDSRSAAKELGVHPFTARKLLAQREHYDHGRFNRAYKALAQAEVGMRGRAPATLEASGGVNHGDRLALELALARMLA